jgi:hypothetical protein
LAFLTRTELVSAEEELVLSAEAWVLLVVESALLAEEWGSR